MEIKVEPYPAEIFCDFIEQWAMTRLLGEDIWNINLSMEWGI